ncbi:MAG: NAD/NADP octopine/nopaline dehydrogenase family protein [Anaerolineae bacterium]|nr:NAD/NADP octopine/nopaline dehydrogenase family protein [Anaerolineae bacterium]
MPPKPVQRIAVIGAGNGGHAAAAHMALKGFAVRFYELPRFAGNLRPAQERGGIELTGVVGEGFARPEVITTDIGEAITGATHILVVTQALAHEEVAKLCAPHVEAEQTVLIMPGSGGTLQFAKTFGDMGVAHKVYLAETVTLPYACRLRGPAHVHVHQGSAAREVFASLPAQDNQAVLEAIRPAYPMLTPMTHVVEVALYNPNILLHPIGVLFSLGRIEYSQGEFWMYKEGFTPSVMKILYALEAEKKALLRALDLKPMGFEAFYTYRYEKDWSDFASVASKGPASADTRYITEDIPIGMVFWASLGELLGVPTPTARALIHISSVIHDTDYWQGGRTVEKLGLAGMTAPALKQYLLEGSPQTP